MFENSKVLGKLHISDCIFVTHLLQLYVFVPHFVEMTDDTAIIWLH